MSSAPSLAAPRSLYLHIPFCLHKCHYCDFAVRVLHRPAQITRYLQALTHEISLWQPQQYALETIYLGGGTPSLLSPDQVGEITEALQQAFDLTQLQEFTFEVNPETISTEKFATLRALGINRLSIGVQSFDPAVLQAAGRTHTPEQVKQGVQLLRQLGYHNLSLDLIYGLPGQNLASWKDTLQQACELSPEHLSLYGLEVHESTAFGYWDRQERLTLPPDDTLAACYEVACEILDSAGYQHYEIANWAQPGRESRHNLTYWANLPYLAAGVGAHGYWQGFRYANPDRMLDYYQQGEQHFANRLGEPLSPADEIAETVFLNLRRLKQGLDLEVFQQRFGGSLEQFYPGLVAELTEQGLLQQVENRLQLTEQAVLVSNEVFARFLEPEV